MKRRRFKSPIPKTAREVIDKTSEDGTVEESSYFVGRTRVGRRIWWDGGVTIESEYGLKGGKKHGNELRFYPDGSLLSVEPYRDGKEHGKAWQFAPDGSVLITYVLKDGVGMDLWCHEDGSLAEEHYFPAPGELGHNRLWNGNNTSIYQEAFWLGGGGWHGIRREWNLQGKLLRGFPQFFSHGERVTKRQYLRACQSDQSLPPYLPQHDQPFRPLPEEYLAQRRS
jgi:antitoxin component YwqK of YwqJK toxin-antitoxin module